jgi:hypothetical protein
LDSARRTVTVVTSRFPPVKLLRRKTVAAATLVQLAVRKLSRVGDRGCTAAGSGLDVRL